MLRPLMSMLALALVGLFVTTGCDNVGVTPDDVAPLYMEVNETTSFDLLESQYVVVDGTVEQAPQLLEGRESDRRVGPHDRRGPDGRPHFHPFGRLLNALHLTEEQRGEVKSLMDAHAACVKEAMAAYREYMHEFMAKYREAHAEIIAALRAGEITPEEAREAMKALRERMRAALENDESRMRLREVIKDCDNAFYRGLAQILDDDQKAILERWLASRRNG